MKRFVTAVFAAVAVASGTGLFAQSAPEIPFESRGDLLRLHRLRR